MPNESPDESSERDQADPLTPDRFRRTDAVFDAALELEPNLRAEFVRRACVGDARLAADVERLLRAHERGQSFLSEPAGRLAESMDDGWLEHTEISETGDISIETPHPAQIGSYRIERALGQGGSGVVYLAQHLDGDARPSQTPARIALKLLRGGAFVSGPPLRRFLAERQILASLEHPHIAHLIDSGVTSDGAPYFTMAYCEGGSLADRLASLRPISVDEALRIAGQLAAALAAAHEAGVTHRDVKPANVLFDARGDVQLSDFGVAKLQTDASTQSGTIIGTVAYLAPEQVRGEHVDHRTDLWALGVTLYEILSARRPFRGESYGATLHAIVSAKLDPVAWSVPDVPPAVDDLLRRLLEKDPDARPQSAREVERAIADARAGRRVSIGRSALRSSARALRRHGVALAATTGVTVVAIMSILVFQTSIRSTGASIAVLPFVNLGSDSTNNQLSDGLTDQVASTLGRIPDLRVTGRTSAASVNRSKLGLRGVGAALGVEYLIEGSVRAVGDRRYITTRLVRARDSTVLWSESYDREMKDLLGVQNEIARAIGGALRLTVDDSRGPVPRATTNDVVAHGLYLKGLYYLNRVTGPNLQRAIEAFQSAVGRDSSFAQAYAGLANAYSLSALFGQEPPAPLIARARAAAEHALRLDSTMAEAHASLGHILGFEWDWERSEREYQRAIALNPSHDFAHRWYGIRLASAGRFAEAEAELRRFVELDPLNPASHQILGRFYVNARRPDDAIRELQEAIDLNPGLMLAHEQLAGAYLQKGMHAAAVKSQMQAALLGSVDDSTQLAYVLAATGDATAARDILGRLLKTGSRRYIPPVSVAMTYAALANADSAFLWLDRGYAQRARFMDAIAIAPAFESLHGDPRWTLLVGRMGLPQPRGARPPMGSSGSPRPIPTNGPGPVPGPIRR